MSAVKLQRFMQLAILFASISIFRLAHSQLIPPEVYLKIKLITQKFESPSQADLDREIIQVNQLFTIAGIKFISATIETRDAIPPCTVEDLDNSPEAEALIASDASKYSGVIPVYLCPKRGGGRSALWQKYAIISTISYRHFSHELGHFFGLAHTHPGTDDQTDEQVWQDIRRKVKDGVDKQCAYKPWSDQCTKIGNELLEKALDGDGLSDTGPAVRTLALPECANAGCGDQCSTNFLIPVSIIAANSPKTSTVRTFYARPDQQNVMSYFNCGTSRFSIMQGQLMRTNMLQPLRLGLLSNNDKINVTSLTPTGMRAVWTWTWGTGWTHFMPFTLGGKQYYLAYNSITGLVHFDRLRSGGQGPDGIWVWTWGAGITHFIPYEVNGTPHFLAYHRPSGTMHFDRVRPDGKGIDILIEQKWEDWSHFMPFKISEHAGFLAYNSKSGKVRFYTISADGRNANVAWEWNWAPGWTHFTPFYSKNQPYYIAYNFTTGAVHFDRIRSDLQGIDSVWAWTWGAGWTHLTTINNPNRPYFTAYNAQNGIIHFDKIKSQLNGPDVLAISKRESGSTSFVEFRESRQNGEIFYQLDYNSTTGKVVIYQMMPELFP